MQQTLLVEKSEATGNFLPSPQFAMPVFIGADTAARYQQKIKTAGTICSGESLSAGLRSMSRLLKTGT